jgi:IMP dehydrogenase
VKIDQGYDFDDVLIKPIISYINSRSDVDISVNVCDKFKLDFPVISSPMRGIIDAKFCKLFSEYGGISILHRFYNSKEEWENEIEEISTSKLFGLSIGLGNLYYKELLKRKPNILLIDVSNGYTNNLREFCKIVKEDIINISPDTLLMSGNVCTYDGVESLYNSGCDMVRVGIGGGAVCSTRNITGIAVPQISALVECSDSDAFIVADGGIRNSGDAVKAFVAGGQVIMIGSMLGQTYESPATDVVYGMASRRLMEEMAMTQIKSVEGIEKAISKKMSLGDFIDDFSWGIRSAGTYLNAKNLQEIKSNGKFILSGKGSIKHID